MLQFLQGKASNRKFRLFALACCRRVQHLMVHDVSCRALEVAQKFADGQASADELETANDAASDVAHLPFGEHAASWPPVSSWYAARAACGAEIAARSAPASRYEESDQGNALYVAWAAGAATATDGIRWDDAAWDKVLFAAWARYYGDPGDRWGDFCLSEAPFELGWDDFADYSGWVAERKVQTSLVHDLFGNPFRPVTIDHRWLTSTVVDLASAIYDEKALDRMPILADALMDAGCDNDEIISHCRGSGPHVRGCCVVDSILGKS